MEERRSRRREGILLLTQILIQDEPSASTSAEVDTPGDEAEADDSVATPPPTPTEDGVLKKLSLKIRNGLRESVENLTSFGKEPGERRNSQGGEGQDN